MAEQEYQTYEQSDLSGGLNESADPGKLDPRYMIVLTNFYYDPVKGVIKKRGGYQKYMSTNATSGARAKAMHRYYRQDDKDLLIVAHESNSEGFLKYWDTSSNSWTHMVGTNRNDDNGNYFFAVMNDLLVVCNGEATYRTRYFKNDASERMFALGMQHPDFGSVVCTAETPGTGNLSDGVYKFLFTYEGPEDFESYPGREGDPDLEVTLGSGTDTQSIDITGLPTTTPTYQESHKNVYRTAAGGAVYYKDGQNPIANSSYISTNSDSTLRSNAELATYDNYPAPLAKYPCVHKDRLFIGGGKQTAYIRETAQNKDIGTKSTLWFSKVAEPGHFPLINYINFAPEDGDEIRGVVSFAGRIFVFKDRHHFTLSYSSDPLGGYVDQFSPGLLADRTPVVCDVRPRLPQGGLIWLARDRRVYLHDGAKAQPISDPIQASLDAITLSNLSSAVSVWYPDKSWYMLSVDSDADGKNDRTYIFDLTTLTWFRFDYGMAAACYWGGNGDNNELIVGSLNDTSATDIYQLDTGTTDSGAAIAASLSTPPLALGNTNSVKQARKLYVEGKCENGQAATIAIYGNRETAVLQSLTLTGDGTEGQHKSWSLNVNPKTFYRMKITADNPDPFELIRFGVVYLTRREEYSLTSISGGIGPGETEAS